MNAKSSHPLQDKFAPAVRALVEEGVFARVFEEHDLSKSTGRPYQADFLALTPSGMLFDIEVDHPGNHDAESDYERDEVLVIAGISTIRVSGREIDDGSALAKVRRLVGQAVSSGKPIEAGSTRSRRVRRLAAPDPGLCNVGIYLGVSHRNGTWGWALQARRQENVRGRLVPDREPLAEVTGSIPASSATSKRDVACRALSSRAFWESVPRECNVRIYSLDLNAMQAAEARGGARAAEELARRNVVSSQSVKRHQCRSEEGTNFAVLRTIGMLAGASAETA